MEAGQSGRADIQGFSSKKGKNSELSPYVKAPFGFVRSEPVAGTCLRRADTGIARKNRQRKAGE